MFEVKGDQPQWKTIYEQLATMTIGDTIKDAELFTLLPDAPEPSIRGAFWRAVKEMEDEHKRSFTRVRITGYRMVQATEHERLARDQHKKAKRRMNTAMRKAHSADRTLMDADARRRIDAIEDHLGRQAAMIRRLEAQQEKTAARVARTEKDSANLADRIDRLTDLFNRHGITGDEPVAS